MKTCAFTKTYGKRTVLQLPELELFSGEITAVLGANGSGKTTLARVLAGVETADGKAAVLSDVSIGYMPQKSYAFRMSTEKNIRLNGGDRRRAEELMERLQISPLSRQAAKKLSGGETARMALCRLLMRRYDLLILDEPTASMDMESTLAAESLICDTCKADHSTVLLITHSIQQARRIAGHVIFLHQGRLVEQGEVPQVLDVPAKAETRDFLQFYGT